MFEMLVMFVVCIIKIELHCFRGSTQEVAWLMDANHGGGYSYRLCKIPPEGRSGLTEECFQEGHLAFAGPGRLSTAIYTPVE